MSVVTGVAVVGLLLFPAVALAQRAGPTAGMSRDAYVKAAQARAGKLAGRRFDQIDSSHKGVIGRAAYIQY